MKSAGTLGIDGMPPSMESIKVIADEGIGPEGLISKGISHEDINWADLILVMEPFHREKIAEFVPEAIEKVMFLGKFNPDRGDMVIPDPIGRPLAFYRVTFRVIRQSIEELIKVAKTVAIGCDHGGFDLKEKVIRIVEDQGYKVLDVGTFDSQVL